jgi:hypothetical protein
MNGIDSTMGDLVFADFASRCMLFLCSFIGAGCILLSAGIPFLFGVLLCSLLICIVVVEFKTVLYISIHRQLFVSVDALHLMVAHHGNICFGTLSNICFIECSYTL